MKKQKINLNPKKLWLILILVSIIFVPSFYGFMYLKSYWNDSSALNKVPIAVVNLDQSYTKDGKTYNIGQSIVDNLKKNNTLDWQFVNYNTGNSGLYGDKYYAMLVIPKNFSEEIANASTDGFKKPEIEFYQNQGENYVFSQVSGFGAKNIEETISQSISKSVSSVLVQTIYQTKDGFKSAANGASQLQTGLNKLADGSTTLSSGMNKLQNGSSSLSTGVNKLQNGSTQLVSGVNKLQNGSSSLSSGINKLQSGSSKLVNGIDQLQQGSQSLVSGMKKLQGGAQTLQSGVTNLKNGSSTLSSGIAKLQSGSATIVNGQAGVNQELQVLNELLAKGDTTEATALAQKITAQSNELKSGMESLNQGLNSAGTGAQSINQGLSSLSTGVSSLNNGINETTNGATSLNTGISSVSTGMNSLNGGLSSAATGATALSSGLGTLSTGASALDNGLSTVSNGISTLNEGLTSAQAGVTQLSNGLKSANTGALTLSSGLTSGYNKLNNNVTFTADEMSDFISNPIVLKTITINPVSSYGEGFAPYFMCIALWVGAMYVYFVISALSRKFEGSFIKRFTKMYLIGSILSIIQAILMSTIVYFGLGMHSNTPLWFYGVNVLTSLAIYSLMNGLHYIIAPIMKGAIVVLMVLQFTSCGGSYPVLMLPSFFKAISPFAVLTYGVNSMRMAISGINYSIFYNYLLMLVLFIVLSIIIGFLVGYYKTYIAHKKILKEKSELIKDNETFNQYV